MAFRKIDGDGALPGPRAIFYSGYGENLQENLGPYLNERGLEGVSLIPCREDSLNLKVAHVLKDESTAPAISPEKLPRVMLLSGLEHRELEIFLGDFKNTGLVRPIFATTTLPNLDFSVKELLNHLLSEQRSMGEAVTKQSDPKE